MKNKVIGIYAGSLFFPPDRMHKWDEHNLETGGIGGCEIWAIEISRRFEKNGFHTMIFCDCEKWHYDKHGVEYVPLDKFDFVCNNAVFNIFITSRRTDILNTNIKSEKTYLMCHDPFVLWCDSYDNLKMNLIDKIAYQSDFQKRLLKEKYDGLTDGNFFKTFQAIDMDLYSNIDMSLKKNKMLWSSHKIRGAKILIEKILPLIRKEIPDFEIDICGYVNDMDDQYFKAEGVNVLGNVSKSELVRIQKECKIWIYPNWGRFDDGRINDETFCITAIENGMANNALVLADRTCFSTTLNGYGGFVGTEMFGDRDIIDESEIDEFAMILAEQAVKILKDDEYRCKLADDACNISKAYNWDSAAMTFIDEYNNTVSRPIENKIQTKARNKLILMTAAFRIYNMDKIFDSIKTQLAHLDIDILWLICHDVNNGGNEEKMRDLLEKCRSYVKENKKFGFVYFPIINENKANYGGDMFNEALKYTVNNYTGEDIWVYILDDDNIINPLMSETLVEAIDTCVSKGKEVVYFNIMYENGICGPVCHTTFVPSCKRTNFIPYYLVTDPSQIVLKYSLIKDMGYYTRRLKYDEDIFFYIVSRVDKICFPEEWTRNKSQDLNRYQTYHNAIASEEDKHKWIEIIKDDTKAKSCIISICTNDDGNRSFVISKEDCLKIMNECV